MLAGAAVIAAAGPAAAAGDGPPPVPEWAEVVATGLANPRGMSFGDDGALYIAEAGIGGDGHCEMGPEGAEECHGGSGGVTRVADGQQERIIDNLVSRAAEGGMNASGPNDVASAGGAVYVLVGYGGDPQNRDPDTGSDQFGYLLRSDGDGIVVIADVAGYEVANNPDGQLIDSNPYSFVVADDGSAIISDAGANALLAIDSDGEMSTLAVFPTLPAAMPDGTPMDAEPVPTGIAVGADDTVYAGALTGFPFPPGGAPVFSIPAAGGEPAVAAEEFTNVIDVAVADDGTLYVLEFNRGGLLSIDPTDPTTLEGQLTKIDPDGTRSVVAAEGLIAPTSVALDADGVPHVAVFGVLGDAGQVWKIIG